MPSHAAILDHVSLDLGTRRVLDDISLVLPKRKLTAIVGPNGCGKSTLTRLLTAYLYPTLGTVEVLGRRLGETNVHELRRDVKLVGPSSVHEPAAEASVRDVVLTGAFGTIDLFDPPTDDDRARSVTLLDRFGLAAIADQPFRQCSSGERMRAQLARSLMSRPKLLILDEPTSGLDLPARERLLATIESTLVESDSPTILIVTHHIEELPPTTAQILLMRAGRVMRAGLPGEVLTSESMSATFDYPIEVVSTSGRFVAHVVSSCNDRFDVTTGNAIG